MKLTELMLFTRENFIKRQIKLSEKLEKEGKTEKTAAFEQMIGKARGIFIDRKENHY